MSMFKVLLTTFLLTFSIATADEISELASRAQNCIAVPSIEPDGIHRLKADGSEVIFGSLRRLDYPPTEKSSPNGFRIAGLSGSSIKWIAVVDTNTSPPTVYNSRYLEGALDWTGLPQDVLSMLSECGFNFGGDSVEPPLRDGSKADGAYPEFSLPKMDWN